jgi:hypothetical protein
VELFPKKSFIKIPFAQNSGLIIEVEESRQRARPETEQLKLAAIVVVG